MDPQRVVHLSVGLSPAMKAVGVVFGLIFSGVSAAIVLFALGVATFANGDADGFEQAGDGVSDPGITGSDLPDVGTAADGVGWFVGGIGVLCGVPFVLLGIYLVIHAVRHKAWLQGTRAYVRGALLTRSADLATADISAGVVRVRENRPGPYDAVHRIPAIVARDSGSGLAIKIPLRGRGLDLLPRNELTALADALTAGRPTGPENEAAHAIAARLRQMANDPLAV